MIHPTVKKAQDLAEILLAYPETTYHRIPASDDLYVCGYDSLGTIYGSVRGTCNQFFIHPWPKKTSRNPYEKDFASFLKHLRASRKENIISSLVFIVQQSKEIFFEVVHSPECVHYYTE